MPAQSDPESLLSGLHFAVEIMVDGLPRPVCNAAFAECDGLEMSMQVRTIREGGDNNRQIHFAGPVNYSNVRLRRGMTRTFDLWTWFARTAQPGGFALRASYAAVVLLNPDGNPQARFILERCLPVGLKGPHLHALDGVIAIEELELAYESLRVEQPA